ncbi:MAG TPA: LLM class F420-dependent oxidoreductase [Acidimicrobiia bacterium]|nr:LLM class F420-dependent oxidoreductase [Acidimicrobiia bacterium]
MRLSTTLPYGGDAREAVQLGRRAESLGFDMLWVPEVYTFDAVSLLGALAESTSTIGLGTAILPLYSRTPTLIAMTAAGLDALSAGRFVLGLGASGPQVIEGWHGVAYDHPLGRTRETVEICRKVWRREILTHDGPIHPLPLPDGIGLPLKLINRPVRPRIPIHLAALGSRNVALAAEIAEGWLPAFFDPERSDEVWGTDLAEGLGRRDPEMGPLEITAGCHAAVCARDEVDRLRASARERTALYVGGMGAPGRNFYNDLFARYGYEEQARRIQQLYLSGRKEEAAEAVPDEYLDRVHLIGEAAFVADRLAAYRAAGVTMLDVTLVGPEPERTLEVLRS